MPKKLRYNSYDVVSGLAQGEDDQIFKSLLPDRLENLKYIKKDSLNSINHYRNLGLDQVASNRAKKYIQTLRHKNTLLALTYDEIFRVEVTDPVAREWKTTKVGDYLNADVETHIVKQLNEDIFAPAITIRGDRAYCLYKTRTSVFFEIYNLHTKSTELSRSLVTSDYERFRVAVNQDRTEVTLTAYTSTNDKYVDTFYTNQVSYNLNFTFEEKEPQLAISKSPTEESVTIGGKKFNNLRVWATFNYSGKGYYVVWTKNNAYYILTDEGVPVAKLGIRSAPSFDADYFVADYSSQAVKIDGDNIYIPLLLNTKESVVAPNTELQDDQRNENRELFFPLGFNIIQIKVDKLFPKVNAVEYGLGTLLSGPIIQNYDGNRFTEFNFCQRLEDISVDDQNNFETDSFPSEITFNEQTETNYQTPADVGFSTSKIFDGFRSGANSVNNVTFRNDGANNWFPTSSGNVNWVDGLPIVSPQITENYNASESLIRSSSIDIYTWATQDEAFRSSSYGLNANDLVDTLDTNDASGDIELDRDRDVTITRVFIARRLNGDIIGIYYFQRYSLRLRSDDNDNPLVEVKTDLQDIPASLLQSEFGINLVDDSEAEATLEAYDLTTPIVIRRSGSSQEDDISGLSDIFQTEDVDTTGFQKLSTAEGESDYSVRIDITENNLDISIRNDGSGEDPPERDLFGRASIILGANVSNFNLTSLAGAVHSTTGKVRTISVPKGDFDQDTNQSTYQLLLVELSPAKYVDEVNKVVTLSGDRDVVNKIEVSEDTLEVKVFLNNRANFSNNIRLSIEAPSGLVYVYPSRRNDPDNSNAVIYSRTGSPIQELIGSERVFSLDVDFNFYFVPTGAFDPTLLTRNEYRYVAYYKWNDAFGKVHVSALSNIQRVNVFGDIGQTYTQGSLSQKITLGLKFNSLDLTTKQDVTLVIGRLKFSSDNVTADTGLVYKIVKEIVITPNNEAQISFTDDVPDSNLYGVIPVETYSTIIQPAGAKSVAIGRRNRIFLGEVNGYQNSVFFSTFIDNTSVHIFSFSPETQGILVFENRVLGMENLDTNLLVFTERKIFYIPVQADVNVGIQALNPQFIQESENNYCTQSEGIVSFKNGVAFVNNKGIQFVTRGFGINWISRDVIDTLVQPGVNIVDAKSSSKDREVRFRLSNGQVLIYNYEYGKWYLENYILGCEQDFGDLRYKFNLNNEGNSVLYVSSEDAEDQRVSRSHVFETGWLNFQSSGKSILLRNIDLIGDFGDYRSIILQISYDYKDNNPNDNKLICNAKYSENPACRVNPPNKIVRFSSRSQKIYALRLKFIINSPNIKLSSLGFEVRKQIAGGKLGQSGKY